MDLQADARVHWGGDWPGFKDLPHFEVEGENETSGPGGPLVLVMGNLIETGFRSVESQSLKLRGASDWTGQGQRDGEGRALPCFAFHGEAAAVALGDDVVG